MTDPAAARRTRRDRIIHDAECAEAGADFADTMATRDRAHAAEYRRAGDRLRAKAKRLRGEASHG